MKYKLLRFSLLSILAMLGGVVHADDVYTYIFTSKSWEATLSGNVSNWVSEKGGNMFSDGRGVQVTTGSSGANATSPYSFTAISNITVTYSTNAKAGAGSISLQVGENDAVSKNITSTGGTTDRDLSFDFATSQSGKVKLSVTCSTNSIYVKSVTINGKLANITKTSIQLGEYQTLVYIDQSIDLPTATVAADETPVSGAEVTWSSSDESVAIIEGKTIKGLAEGTTTIKAVYAGDDSYYPSEASFELTVEESPIIANPYAYSFEKKVFDKDNLTQKLKAVDWTVESNGNYWGYDGTKGQQFGSKDNPATTLTLSTSDIPGTITSVKINTSGANDIAATVGVTVGGKAFNYGSETTASLTATATDYEFTGSASGEIKISYAQTSSKAIYIKSIEVTYSTEEPAGFRDFAVNLTNADAIPTTNTNFGVKVAEDGSYTAVAADDATANFTVSANRFNDAQHGWVDCVFTVPVEGAVKIELGDCQYGAQSGTIVDAEGNSTDIKANATKKCWDKNAPHDNVVVAYYAGTSATTLTITYNGYSPFIAVTSIDPSQIPNEATLTFNVAAAGAEGLAPAAQKVEIGSTVTIPANTTLYKEGYTLTAWTDGSTNYIAGQQVTVSEDMSLTPVFTENAVTFADRTAETTLVWQFGEGNGVGTLNAQGKSTILVTQATIGETVIDVKMDIDATNGKINNVGRGDKWAKCNDGTKMTIPAYKGTAVSFDSYSDGATTTIGGVTATDKAATYEGTAETLDIVAGGMDYIASVTAVYPVPANDNPGDETNVIYSWTGEQETGGTVVASDDQSVGYSNAGNTTIRLNGTADFSGATVTITLDKALKAGDEIAITAYRNKNAADKQSGVKMKFEKGETTVGSETGLEYVNIDTSDASVGDSNRGTEPNTCTFTVPTDADGSQTITMTRSHQGTNCFITKIEITGERSGDEPIVEPTEFVFRDFQMDLRDANGGILTADESSNSQTVNFGITVDENNGLTRVEADAENTAAVISGATGNNHGLQRFSATVPVEGAVQITMSTCSWGGDVTVKNAEGETVATFTTKKGEGGSGCYGGNGMDDDNIISAKYVGEATTLTIEGGAYVGFFAVQAIEASSVEVAYSLGDVECQGDIVPTGGTYAKGDEYTIPAQNFTLYKEGCTLTGWTDGENTYAVGETITLTTDLNLTPVFTQNKVNLADRTEPVTVKFDFQKNNGAPNVQWQNQDNLVWVAQAKVNGTTIDVPTHFSTNPGKFNNTNWGDWCQINNGTTFTIPSCKGATVSVEAYSELSELTIDGQNDYTSAKTISYEIAGSAQTVDVVFGSEGQYYRYIQVVLPVVQSQGGGESYVNEVAKVVWSMTDTENPGTSEATPKSAFSTIAFDYGTATITGTQGITDENAASTGITGIKFKPATDKNDLLKWYVKPAAGLTFTPTKLTGYVNRCGTDSEKGITISAYTEGKSPTALGTWTALRATKTSAQKPYDATAIYKYTIELTADQQAALASGDGFYLTSTIGVGNTKDGAFGEVTIEGIINGTVANVNKYTLATAVAPEAAGSINVYPKSDEYDEGSEVTLTATENFGFDFVNWTNAAGQEVSTEAKFKYTVNSNETLTANFKAVETYELKLTVDGTNDYMVTVSPEPTVVDGKNMYEAGTAVSLTANQYEGLVTFTNWSDGETGSSKIVSMADNIELTALYAQADIIAGWDFYKSGNNGRKADFYAQDNDADALNLVNTESGETSGWLDKSTLGGGGYESFKGAAVNWRTGASNGDVGNWHWQTKVNAEAFTDINVQFQMLYNYNAYQTYDAEFSLDGENWTKFGNVTMEGNRVVGTFSEKLPAAANNQKDLYIRMKADKTSKVDGAASANDGNTLAMFFITGTPKLVDDGVAPKLVSSVPATGATGASAAGKIVLTFDERVKVAEGTKATLGTAELTPTVSGKTVTFEYKGLEYSTEYTFTLPANSVSDLTDNKLAEAITISFTTMTRPAVTKGTYDAVVSTVEELTAAIAAAQARADKNTRFRIFIKNGKYTLPRGNEKSYRHTNGKSGAEEVVFWEGSQTDPITYINTNNVSFIGESRDGVIITNDEPDTDECTFTGAYGKASVFEGIGNSDVFQLRGEGYYWQDLTVETGMEDGRGRDIAIQDRGTKNVYKNVGLRGYQDTWTSNNDNGLYYFEGGYVRGRTDYMCGKGDIFWNGVELRQIAGGYAAVPSKPAKYGWIYKDCVINGEGSGVDGNYTLGRPWGSGTPIALFIDTRMNVVPSAIGWNEMSNGWPARFAEYNSTTSTGSVIDLSGRKKTFGDGHENNPVLTAEEALEAGNLHNMFGEWDPTLQTEQAPLPKNVALTGNTLTWDDSNYALLWAIVKDGAVIDFTTEPQYTVDDPLATYAVRAANEMGGLSEASAEVTGAVTVDVTVTIPASGYATLASDKALDFTGIEGLTAYIVSAKSENTATLTAVDAAPAGTGLVLKGTGGSSYTIPVAETEPAAITNNLLIGAVGGAEVTASSVYVLDGGMFKVFSGTQILPGKAYLPKTTGDARQLELVFDGEATGIAGATDLMGSGNAGNEVYNLNGQRVRGAAKGIYIMRGKKVIVK